jgi:hypothetical protein
VRRAGRPSWQIVVDHPQVLAIALYIRDVAGIRHEALPADLPAVVPPAARAEESAATTQAAAEWNAWWTRTLATGPRALTELRPPSFPAFADVPALQRLLREHFDAARRWSESGKRDHADHMTSNSPPLGRWVEDVGRALGRPVAPFTLRIDEVPVAGETWRQVSDAHVLVSPALLRNPAALVTELRPAIRRLA